jgi:hypothetical protein
MSGAPTDDFLSGTSGGMSGIRATARARIDDALADGLALARWQAARLQRATARSPRRRVLVLAIERPGVPNVLAGARAELLASRHDVRFQSTEVGEQGKWENLDDLLERHPATGSDWLLVVDDDVVLPRRFLDNFVFLAERFGLRLAQPAHRRRSHAAWEVARRRPGTVVRETAFIEIGPVSAFHAETFDVLLPFPRLRVGWGLDAHWAAVARARGWRVGVVDATPVRHGLRPIASAYDRTAAIEEARRFLAGRPYIPATEAQRTLVAHRSW